MPSVPPVRSLDTGDQSVRLALGYSAAAINVALTLDEDGRISTKILPTARSSSTAGRLLRRRLTHYLALRFSISARSCVSLAQTSRLPWP